MKGFEKRGTKRYNLGAMFAQGLTAIEAYTILKPLVIAQTEPWIFRGNVAGVGRVPKVISAQLIDCKNEVNRVWNYLGKNENPVPAEGWTPDTDPVTSEEEFTCEGCNVKTTESLTFHNESGLHLCSDCFQVANTEPEKPVAASKSRKLNEKKRFMSEWRRIRQWISDTAERVGSSPIDSLDSNRPVLAASRMIDAGISADACLFAMTQHWPKASRENAGISDVDFLQFSEDLGHTPDGFEYHKLAGYVRKLSLAAMGQGFGVFLIGPAGSGKSTCAEQVASLIRTESHPDGLPYGETPITPGASRGDLLGRPTFEGFVTSQFVEIYSGGGVFNFEEIDAADPRMLLVVNNALAGSKLFNSMNGKVYRKHCDFIAMGTGNTFGLGADSKYTGREKLDLATIDRFRMARVVMGLDEKLSDSLMFGVK